MKEGWEFNNLQLREYCHFEIVGDKVTPIKMIGTITKVDQSKITVNLNNLEE